MACRADAGYVHRVRAAHYKSDLEFVEEGRFKFVMTVTPNACQFIEDGYRFTVFGSPSVALTLGFYNSYFARLGVTRKGSGDPHFTGQLAIGAFNAAGGTDYQGNKVPIESGCHHRLGAERIELPRHRAQGPAGGRSLGALHPSGVCIRQCFSIFSSSGN